jgi:hypothetical protein
LYRILCGKEIPYFGKSVYLSQTIDIAVFIYVVGRHVYPGTVVSVSLLYANPTKRVGLVQSGPHHHLIEN